MRTTKSTGQRVNDPGAGAGELKVAMAAEMGARGWRGRACLLTRLWSAPMDDAGVPAVMKAAPCPADA